MVVLQSLRYAALPGQVAAYLTKLRIISYTEVGGKALVPHQGH